MNIVILGLSITSSWGNGHATTYRALVRELARRGHSVQFLERDVPWYASNRDLQEWPHGRINLYQSVADLFKSHRRSIRDADAVIVGSYVPDGVDVGNKVLNLARGVVAFYDIDTPVTLARLEDGTCEYVARDQIPFYDLYLSFAGGPTLSRLEQIYGSPCAEAFYCSVDPELYYPESIPQEWDLGYLGTYSPDRQPGLERLLTIPASRWQEGRFIVAGPQYPEDIEWPPNVRRVEHLPPSRHRNFYNSQRHALNITRSDMIAAGYSPSVRLFEAAACATPVISDYWEGLEDLFQIGSEILVARNSEEMMGYLREQPAPLAREIGRAARERVLAAHTASHRAAELESHLERLIRSMPTPIAASI
jgi:spore maturation protein CgeB